MLRKRIIPCLLLKNEGLVKTVKFGKPSYVGDPINTIKLFNDKMADELMILDIGCGEMRLEPNYELIEPFASEAFMPLSYGGGISKCDQIQKILRLGVEKVVLHSSVMKSPELLKSAAERFGSSTLTVCINVKKSFFGSKNCYSKFINPMQSDPILLAQAMERAGAGELLIQSVDRDGTMMGYDHELCKVIADAVGIPVVACGGAANFQDMATLFRETKVSAVAAGSLFVYQGPHRAVLISYPRPDDVNIIINSPK